MIDSQTEEVLDLSTGDQDRDAVGETDNHGTWNEAYRCAKTGNAHEDQNDPGDQGTDVEPFNPITGNDAGHDNDERSGRSADLSARAAESRNEPAGKYCRVQASLWRHSGSDSERHCQRQGDESYGDTREQIGEELLRRVAPQAEHRFRQPLGKVRHLRNELRILC